MRSLLPAKNPATKIPNKPPRKKMSPLRRFRVLPFCAIFETGARRTSSALAGEFSREGEGEERPEMRLRRLWDMSKWR